MSELGKAAMRRKATPRKTKARATSTPRNRFAEFNAFVDLHVSKLKQSDSLVWITIWRHVDHRTGTATLTHNRIGQTAGLQRRAVTNVVRRLTEAGYLEVVRKGAANRSPTVFKPTIPPPQTGAPPCARTGAP